MDLNFIQNITSYPLLKSYGLNHRASVTHDLCFPTDSNEVVLVSAQAIQQNCNAVPWVLTEEVHEHINVKVQPVYQK